MTDDADLDDAAFDDAWLDDAVLARLRDPSTWEPPPAGMRANVLAAVLGPDAVIPPRPAAAPVTEMPAEPEPEPEPEPEAEPQLAVVRQLPRRRLVWAVPLTAAAAAALTFGAIAYDDIVPRDRAPQVVALGSFPVTGTGTASDATGEVTLAREPAGVSILLDVSGLPPAGPDQYYSAWMVNGTIRVPAGSFHNRATGDPVKLWSGVDPAQFQRFTVTLQSSTQPPEAKGTLVLEGRISG